MRRRGPETIPAPAPAARARSRARRRRRSSRRTLLETRSPYSGRIRVEQRGPERRLIVGGEIQSVYFTDLDWSRARREYWARALADPLPGRPRVLFVGLGGATQVHLLRLRSRPRLISVIERDPAVLRIARKWFGLDRVGGLQFLCTDAERAIAHLTASRRRFDFIMDDISYAVSVEDAIRTASSLARLVAPAGLLVLNQHTRRAARAVAAALRGLFPRVGLRRVRRRTENVLVIARAESPVTTRRDGQGPAGVGAARPRAGGVNGR